MIFKRWMVRKLVDWTHDWNSEIHRAIEAKVHAEYRAMWPDDAESLDAKQKTIGKMRDFYYARMNATASLLFAGVALVVAATALVLAVIPLLHQLH